MVVAYLLADGCCRMRSSPYHQNLEKKDLYGVLALETAGCFSSESSLDKISSCFCRIRTWFASMVATRSIRLWSSISSVSESTDCDLVSDAMKLWRFTIGGGSGGTVDTLPIDSSTPSLIVATVGVAGVVEGAFVVATVIGEGGVVEGAWVVATIVGATGVTVAIGAAGVVAVTDSGLFVDVTGSSSCTFKDCSSVVLNFSWTSCLLPTATRRPVYTFCLSFT